MIAKIYSFRILRLPHWCLIFFPYMFALFENRLNLKIKKRKHTTLCVLRYTLQYCCVLLLYTYTVLYGLRVVEVDVNFCQILERLHTSIKCTYTVFL